MHMYTHLDLSLIDQDTTPARSRTSRTKQHVDYLHMEIYNSDTQLSPDSTEQEQLTPPCRLALTHVGLEAN